jgi:hypothetical protein
VIVDKIGCHLFQDGQRKRSGTGCKVIYAWHF